MTSFDVHEVPARRVAADDAIDLALQSRWDEAVEANNHYLEQFPNDTEALNRVGKALMELGRYDEAREAYQRSYDLDRVANVIASKNLQRLEGLSQASTPRPEGSPKIAAELFIDDPGKTGVASLLDGDPKALKPLAVGDSVELKVEGKSLFAVDTAGRKIGEVDPKTGLRLLPLIDSGNTYAAAMHSDGARVIIRETFQSEANVGKLSFAPGQADTARANTRDTLVRADDDEDEAADDADTDWVDTEATEVGEDVDEVVEKPRLPDTREEEEFDE